MEILMFLLKLLLLFFVLGVIILVHEFGHFIWAKKFGVHIYEFSIGMGPIVHTHKGKDKIDYNLRAIPIGGFVSMAGEVYEDNEDIPKDKLLCNKKWWQRLIILVAGVVNNFILAILLLVIYSCIWGVGVLSPVVKEATDGYPAKEAGLKAGDTILAINDYKVTTWDNAQIILYYKNDKDYASFKVRHTDGTEEVINITPVKEKTEGSDTERNVYGISMMETTTDNFFTKISYGLQKTWSLLSSMLKTIGGLITGKISVSNLSGPVGIYTVVGQSTSLGFAGAIKYLVYIIAYLSINVGLINILPFPAFDGGHVLFLIIEIIRGKKVDAKLENMCHTIGFVLIFLLMIYVTFNDILRLF